AVGLRPFASPEARSLVDRIARIQDQHAERPSHVAPLRAREGRSIARSSTKPVNARLPRSVVLATIGALAGVLAGKVLARHFSVREGGAGHSVSIDAAQRR